MATLKGKMWRGNDFENKGFVKEQRGNYRQGEEVGKDGSKKERVGKDAKKPPKKKAKDFSWETGAVIFDGGWILFLSISPAYNIIFSCMYCISQKPSQQTCLFLCYNLCNVLAQTVL